MDFNTLLYDIYYKNKNYDGTNELYKKAKKINKDIKREDVSKWLNSQSTHQQTTVKEIKEKSYLPIYTESHYSFQMDLTFFPRYKKQNHNYYVLFTAININSRYAYAYYAKNKESSTIIEMLNDFLKNALIIESITCDYGSEFIDKNVKQWFNDNEIEVNYVKDDNHTKLSIINRFHRTLKEKLLKHFLANDTTNWVDSVDEIIKNYNNTSNSGIYGFTPKEASKPFIMSYIIDLKRQKTGIVKKTENDNYQINDKVLLLNKGNLFDKMKIKYSDTVYKIIKINNNSVDLETNDKIIRNVKKSNIKKVDEIQNFKPNVEKRNAEKEHKVERITKKIDALPENIINEKRVRKPNTKYL